MRQAKIHIKGNGGKPITVSEEEGNRVADMKARKGEYASVVKDTPVNIGNVWRGMWQDIQFVEFVDVGGQAQVKTPIYSQQQREAFEREIFSYCVKTDDDEYNYWVAKYSSMVYDVDDKQISSAFTKSRIKAIRAKYDDFPKIEVWAKDKPKLEEEHDNAYQARMVSEYREARTEYLKENLVNRAEEINEDCKQLVKERIVGTLTRKGQMRFLKDKDAVLLDEQGELKAIVKDRSGIIPFTALNAMIVEWMEEKNRQRYVSDKSAFEYEAFSAPLVESMSGF